MIERLGRILAPRRPARRTMPGHPLRSASCASGPRRARASRAHVP